MTQCEVCGSWGCKTCWNHHPSSNMFNTWYEVFDMMGLVFTKHGIIYHVQKSPFWSHLSTGDCFRLIIFIQMHFFCLKVLNVTRVKSERSMEVGGWERQSIYPAECNDYRVSMKEKAAFRSMCWIKVLGTRNFLHCKTVHQNIDYWQMRTKKASDFLFLCQIDVPTFQDLIEKTE